MTRFPTLHLKSIGIMLREARIVDNENITKISAWRGGLQEVEQLVEQSAFDSANALQVATEAKGNADSLRTEVNEIVGRETDTDAMSRQAAVDDNGYDYTVLKNRLDEEHSIHQRWLEDITIFPEQFDAVADGTTDDSTAIINALSAANGKTLKFKQGAIYAYSSKVVSDGLKSATIDFNGATLLDLGEMLPYNDGTQGKNPVGFQFKNFVDLQVKGLEHDTDNMDWGRIAHEDAHLKNASVEFRDGKNLELFPSTFKGTQGALPSPGYTYHNSLDVALNFGHLKVFNVENVATHAFTLEVGGGSEVAQYGKCRNVTVKNSKKLDAVTMLSWSKFIQCRNTIIEQPLFSGTKSTSFVDVSGDDITLQHTDIDYPNGKLLDITNEWGEIGGDIGKVTVDNVRAIVQTGVFCSRMAMDYAPAGSTEYIAIADQVSVKNSTFGSKSGTTATQRTLFGSTDRFQHLSLENSFCYNFSSLMTARTDNTYVGNYTRRYVESYFINNNSLPANITTCGVNTFTGCYFNQNWEYLVLWDDYGNRISGAEASETEFIFNDCKFEDTIIKMEGNIEFHNCKFINCNFVGWEIDNTSQSFFECKFRWDENHYTNSTQANIFRMLTSKELNFNRCSYKGTPRFDTAFFFTTQDIEVDQTINHDYCEFDINRSTDSSGNTGGSYVIEMNRDTPNDVQITFNFAYSRFLGKIIAASMRGYSSINTKLLKLTLENCSSKQTTYDNTIRYATGTGDDFSKMELIMIKNVFSNSETPLGFSTVSFAKFVDIDNYGVVYG